MHIGIIERKMDELRNENVRLMEENKAREGLKELIDQLNQKQSSSSDDTNKANDRDNIQPKFDIKEIESLVSSKIVEHDLTRKQTANFNSVKNKLTERFGANYQSALQQQIEELGLDISDMDALARKSPTAFFKTLGLDQPPQQDGFQAPPRSLQRSDSFKPKVEKRTWSYYQNMKKENPKLYFDAKINNQMMEDYATLGKEFEDGDFHN